jgi:hypothetical protein
MTPVREVRPIGPRAATIEQERDAYNEALEEILTQCLVASSSNVTTQAPV